MTSTNNNTSNATAVSAAINLYIVSECDVELWSLNAKTRLARAFARCKVAAVDDIASSDAQSLVLVRADYLLGQDLVNGLVSKNKLVLINDGATHVIAVHVPRAQMEQGLDLIRADSFDAEAVIDLTVVTPTELGEHYDDALRKRAKPVALRYGETSIDVLEQVTFGAAYKGATDFVTKYIWPRPARTVTRWCAARNITPNQVTTVSLVLVLLATYLFAQGAFLIAIPIAWAMTFLDTVDGKLARVTLSSSPWGNIYDHGIDLIHPPFWWWAWYVGVLPLASSEVLPWLQPSLVVILVGYVIGRLFEGLFVFAFKIETHIWRPLDYFFRTITARRNPNLALLTIATVLERPDIGLLAVAVWTLVSLGFHFARILQAFLVRARGEPISSWLRDEKI